MSASEQDPTLPAAVRLQLVTIAADVLGRTPVAELPPAVRRFARFAPARRVRMGAAEIAAALSVDAGFRDRIADIVTEASPELAARVGAGEVPSAADPVDVAVLAYLLRPPNWHELLTAVSHELVQAEAGSNAELERARAEIERLTRTNAELTRLREAARAAARSTAAEHAAAVAALQGRLRSAQAELRTAQRTVEARERELAERAATADRTRASELAELRKARARIQELEAAAETGRRGARAEREHDEARLWVLLEAITGAAAGLRRELDLTPARRPADSLTPRPGAESGRPSTVDGPLLDRLLDGTHVHLIVDGYNVTKTGYPATLTLTEQRNRLVSALGALAARTSVEVTVAFDGTAAPTGSAASLPTPRGVRVLFSAAGQLADDLIRELLRREPPGRPVVVASSDGAVAASARGAGAWSTQASVLLTRLERGG